jgi:hypothetical protein
MSLSPSASINYVRARAHAGVREELILIPSRTRTLNGNRMTCTRRYCLMPIQRRMKQKQKQSFFRLFSATRTAVYHNPGQRVGDLRGGLLELG